MDGRYGVNMMLEDIAFDLGYTSFKATDQVLRMADQSHVLPIRRFSLVPTLIGQVTYFFELHCHSGELGKALLNVARLAMAVHGRNTGGRGSKGVRTRELDRGFCGNWTNIK